MPRGGPRNGKPGKAYANRTDMGGQNVVQAQPQNQPGAKLAVQAASGQAYGAAGAQKQAQRAVPMGNAPVAQGAPSMGAPATPPIIPLFGATQRPDEPVTTGAKLGDGPDDSSLVLPANPIQEKDPSVQLIRALYLQDPRNEDLRMIIQQFDNEGRA